MRCLIVLLITLTTAVVSSAQQSDTDKMLRQMVVSIVDGYPGFENGGSAIIINTATGTYLVTATHIAKEVGIFGSIVFQDTTGKSLQVPLNEVFYEERGYLNRLLPIQSPEHSPHIFSITDMQIDGSLRGWVHHPSADLSAFKIDLEKLTLKVPFVFRWISLSALPKKKEEISLDGEFIALGFPHLKGVAKQEILGSNSGYYYAAESLNPRPFLSRASKGFENKTRGDVNVKQDFFFLIEQNVPGDSGGPVFSITRPTSANPNGRIDLVGIMHGFETSFPHRTAVTPISYLWDLISN